MEFFKKPGRRTNSAIENMKQLLIIALNLWMLTSLNAQEQFIVKGKIEFEKRVNLHKQIENEEDEEWRNMLKQMMPETKVTYFDLYFNDQSTIYQPGREVVTEKKVPDWMEGPANDNIVFTDLTRQSFTAQKTVFEDIFNIQDSVRKVNWKITADKRTIAGIECRKATAVIMDSVFVVAFYTDQVVTSGGPESFSGLPGMILGLAVPRMHTTWFATRLELIDVKPTVLIAPKKGKKSNLSSLKVQLNSAMKNWGKWRDKNIWQIMI